MDKATDVLYEFLEAWKALDGDRYVSCFARDFVSTHPFGSTSSHADVREELALVAEHWTDLDYRIVNSVDDGENVAIEYVMTMTGTGKGFDGRIELPGLIMATIREGRIAKYREEFDPRIVLAARSGTRSS